MFNVLEDKYSKYYPLSNYTFHNTYRIIIIPAMYIVIHKKKFTIVKVFRGV